MLTETPQATTASFGETRGKTPSAPRIADYGIIGDGRTAALVSNDGAIDWLCLPNFSSPSVFARILDSSRGGSCIIRPKGAFSARRRYRSGTAILETIFETSSGIVRSTDLFPIEDATEQLLPMREVLRLIEGIAGTVAMTVKVDPKFSYGRLPIIPRCRGELGWAYIWSNCLLAVRGDYALSAAGTALEAELDVQAGQRFGLSLAFGEGDVGVWPPLGAENWTRLERTAAWWSAWAARNSYRGQYREAVERSALTLKLLTYCPSGAIVAAASASLPENPGGSRNWDYRYCWLRDAGMTTQALVGLGYMDEARYFLSWLLHATRLTWPHLQVVYDVYGRTTLKECELRHFTGWSDSRPVRIGNAACAQYQIDIYGEVIVAAEAFVAGGGTLEPAEARLLCGLAQTIACEWKQPDNGIWEIRARRRHYTLSKVMCWLGLDRLLSLDTRGTFDLGSRRERFRKERQAIATAIKTQAYDRTLDSYTGVFERKDLDASLLLMGCLGYLAPDDASLVSTQDRIWDSLGTGPLLHRYARGYDGSQEPEGAFIILSFWAVQNLAARGDVTAAHELFEQVLSYANDLGLLAEEADPESRELLGNFPQAFSHVGVINAALAIERAETMARC